MLDRLQNHIIDALRMCRGAVRKLGKGATRAAQVELDGRDPEIYGLEENDRFAPALNKIKEKLGLPDGTSVIYPGSSTHVGAAKVFGESCVTHLDPDPKAISVLRKAGYKAVGLGVEDYIPEETFDVMVALNSYGAPTADIVERLVRDGGYIITNNYTLWAYELSQLTENVQLVGAFMPAYGDESSQYLEATEIPPDVTSLVTNYYCIERSGSLSMVTEGNHNFADTCALYPDALCVFKRI